MNYSHSINHPRLQDVYEQFSEMVNASPGMRALNLQFESLMTFMEEWMDRSPASSEGDQPDTTQIYQLLREFTDFYLDYYHYFVRRVVNGDFGQQPGPSILRQVIKQILEQSTTISRMLNQRRYGSLYRSNLLKADNLASEYYHRYTGASSSPPLVYFEKIYQIERYPYQMPPLVAIPLTDWRRPKDQDAPECTPDPWLPLAHELGHYVFWNGADLDVYHEVQQKFRTIINETLDNHYFPGQNGQKTCELAKAMWCNWLEETFADIFAALVAGPEYALSAQERLTREVLKQESDLLFDDGKHPIAAIRPLIAGETLKHLKNGDKDLVDLFRQRWQPYLDQAEQALQHPAPDTPEYPGARLSPEILATTVPEIVKNLLNRAAPDSPEQKSLLDQTTVWFTEKDKARFLKYLPDYPKLPPLPTELPQIHPGLKSSEVSASYFSKSFDKLRSSIQRNIDCEEPRQAEWEMILGQNLALLDFFHDPNAVHQDPKTGTHNFYHVHKYGLIYTPSPLIKL